jgi:hypothetical protein
MFSVVIAPGIQPNQPPVASFAPDCPTGSLTCSFDASASSDDGGPENLTYDWDFGDGETANQVAPQHTYAKGGNRNVTLTVTDAEGAFDKVTKQIDPWDPNASGDITFVDSATNADNEPTHSVIVPTTVRAGDRLVLFLVTNTTTPTIDDELEGWELLETYEGNGIRGRAWTRSATPADKGREVSVPGSDYAKFVMTVAAYRSTGPPRCRRPRSTARTGRAPSTPLPRPPPSGTARGW